MTLYACANIDSKYNSVAHLYGSVQPFPFSHISMWQHLGSYEIQARINAMYTNVLGYNISLKRLSCPHPPLYVTCNSCPRTNLRRSCCQKFTRHIYDRGGGKFVGSKLPGTNNSGYGKSFPISHLVGSGDQSDTILIVKKGGFITSSQVACP